MLPRPVMESAAMTSLEQTESLVRATELALTGADMDALNAASAA